MLRNVVTLLLTLLMWGAFTLCASAQTLTDISYDKQTNHPSVLI